MADVFAELVTDALGYTCFGAQGGDWGAHEGSRFVASRRPRAIQPHFHAQAWQGAG